MSVVDNKMGQKLRIWTLTATALFNILWSKAQDRRNSLDAHSHDGAGSVSLSFLLIKDGNTSIMCSHYRIAISSPDLHDHTLLTLHGRSFSKRDLESLAFFFALKGCQYCCYVKPLQNYFLIDRLTRSWIVDALLTVIFKMGQGVCCFLFSLQSVATLPRCEHRAKLCFYHPTNKTRNRWCSIDVHSHEGAWSVLHSCLRLKVRNAIVMYNHYKLTS